MTAHLREVTGQHGDVYVLSQQDHDESAIKVEQIRGLCDLMLQYQAVEQRRERFCLEQDNALLSGVNLIERLAGEVSRVLDKAPDPKAGAAT